MTNEKIQEIEEYIKANQLPITEDLIQAIIEEEESEFGNEMTPVDGLAYALAKALELQEKGCLLYSECKNCPVNALEKCTLHSWQVRHPELIEKYRKAKTQPWEFEIHNNLEV